MARATKKECACHRFPIFDIGRLYLKKTFYELLIELMIFLFTIKYFIYRFVLTIDKFSMITLRPYMFLLQQFVLILTLGTFGDQKIKNISLILY